MCLDVWMMSWTSKSAGLGTILNQNAHLFLFFVLFFEIHLSSKLQNVFLAKQSRAPLRKSSSSDDPLHKLEAIESL